jgi:prophage tail gpP-like protein
MAAVVLEVNGVEYEDWVSAQVQIRLDALSNTFGFEAAIASAGVVPFVGNEPCKVRIDGEPVLTGHIELINIDTSHDSQRIDVQGRDRTGDLLDSQIAVLDELNANGLTLRRIAEIIIEHIGSNIEVVDEAGPAPFNLAEDGIAPEVGQDAYEFLEILARKRSVLLTSDADGNLVITRNFGRPVNAYLQHIAASSTNNVLRSSISQDMTGRYNLYYMSSQLNPLAISNAGSISNAQLVDQSGITRDELVRAGRQLVLVSEAMYSSDEARDRVWWERITRWARSTVYTAWVDGFRNQTGELWGTNELVQVVDELCGIDAEMLVAGVGFYSDTNEGDRTQLTCLRRNAFSPEPVPAEGGQLGIGP